MKTISFTLLALSVTIIAANPGTDKESSGINLRGSASSVQDFQSYVKTQYSDDYFKPADVSPSPIVGYDPNPAYLPPSPDDSVKNVVDPTKSKVVDRGSKAGLIDAQKFLEEAEEASLGTNYCRGGGSPCYTYNSHFCCSGVCNRAQSGSPFGYCMSTVAGENLDALVDTTESEAKEEVTIASMIDAQKFLEEAEEASLGTNYCRGGGSPCYTYNSHFCCSGVCNRAQSGSPFGYCMSTVAGENLDALVDTTESEAKEEVTIASMIDAQKFLEEAEEASLGSNYCRGNDSACYTYNSHFCCSGVCIRHQSGSPFGYCAPGAAFENANELMDTTKSTAEEGVDKADSTQDQQFLEEAEEASINTSQCRVNGAPCYDSDLCCSGICKRQHFSDSAPGTCAPF